MNIWAILNTCTKQVVAEATHYQEAARVEDEFVSEWKSNFVGPFPLTVRAPFTCCRIHALSQYYPGYA